MGHWEGDTLVLDSLSFVDTTWLARGGFFHSDRMHVMTPRTLTLNTNPEAGLLPVRGNCEVRETKGISSQIRN